MEELLVRHTHKREKNRLRTILTRVNNYKHKVFIDTISIIMDMTDTTISISLETHARLKKLGSYSDTMDDIVTKLLDERESSK